MTRFRRNTHGWTLIELTIVIALMTILSTIALVGYRNATTRTREAVLKEDLFRMRDAIDQFHADQGMPLSAQVPSHVVLEIVHTEPGIKGNTATNTFKPAKTETGADIQVPLFINEGDKIKIDTSKGSYIERVKE